jgi:hypothetical protein
MRRRNLRKGAGEADGGGDEGQEGDYAEGDARGRSSLEGAAGELATGAACGRHDASSLDDRVAGQGRGIEWERRPG